IETPQIIIGSYRDLSVFHRGQLCIKYIGSGVKLEGVMEGQRDGETHSQYYLAVDRQQFKLGTLVDLLDVIGRRSGLPIVLCCSSRDGLDSVCATISSLPYISLSCLHSDLSEVERASCIDKFRQIALEWMLKHAIEPEGCEDNLKRKSSYLLVMTDSCLPMQALGEAPISGRILINYDLPTKKEAYMRRLAACMAGIHFPTGNKVIGGTIPAMTASTSTINPSH
ncbi:hypothetical protein KI387_020180, partial [Taxus chinensis]